jgi:hypothetical protein
MSTRQKATGTGGPGGKPGKGGGGENVLAATETAAIDVTSVSLSFDRSVHGAPVGHCRCGE